MSSLYPPAVCWLLTDCCLLSAVSCGELLKFYWNISVNTKLFFPSHSSINGANTITLITCSSTKIISTVCLFTFKYVLQLISSNWYHPSKQCTWLHIHHFLSKVPLWQDFNFRRLVNFRHFFLSQATQLQKSKWRHCFITKHRFATKYRTYCINPTKSDDRTHVRRISSRQLLTVFARYTGNKELCFSSLKQHFALTYIYIKCRLFEFVVTNWKLLYFPSNFMSSHNKLVAPFSITVNISKQILTSTVYKYSVRTAQ
jgi:hypothetical protein